MAYQITEKRIRNTRNEEEPKVKNLRSEPICADNGMTIDISFI